MIEKFIENGLHSYDSGIAHEDKNPRYYCTIPRACPHFKNEDKSEVNCSQTRKIAQIISRYYLAN